MRVRRVLPALVVLPALLLAGSAGAARIVTAKKREHTMVTATEVEWHIKLSRTSAPAGSVTFAVHNRGTVAHQFLVLRTSDAANKLPMKGNEVDVKKAGTLEGEIKTVEPGKHASMTVTLKAGRYVLFCNMPGHYKLGQYTSFRVT
jgi:uncharacterized cupredoxin-like copper-binding protein